MNKPWLGMEPYEKNKAMAALVGWDDFWYGDGILMGYPPVEQAMGIDAERHPVPDFINDLNLAAQVEAEIERRGLLPRYVIRLREALEQPLQNTLYLIFRATADQRCEAAYAVLSEAQ